MLKPVAATPPIAPNTRGDGGVIANRAAPANSIDTSGK
jgi:hypothetical protein